VLLNRAHVIALPEGLRNHRLTAGVEQNRFVDEACGGLGVRARLDGVAHVILRHHTLAPHHLDEADEDPFQVLDFAALSAEEDLIAAHHDAPRHRVLDDAQIAVVTTEQVDRFDAFEGQNVPTLNGGLTAQTSITSRVARQDAGAKAETPPASDGSEGCEGVR
jgi:hypothetical protein